MSDSIHHREHIGLAENEKLFAIDRDFGAAVLAVQHLVTDLHVHRHALVFLVTARANGNHSTLLRLFLGGIRDIKPTAHLLRFFKRLDDDAIGERRYLRGTLSGHVC